MRNAARSARSPRCRRQSRAAPLATSIRLSKPKPTSATLPARNPASKATRASRLFHAMVKYSRRWARATARAWFVTGREPADCIIPSLAGQAGPDHGLRIGHRLVDLGAGLPTPMDDLGPGVVTDVRLVEQVLLSLCVVCEEKGESCAQPFRDFPCLGFRCEQGFEPLPEERYRRSARYDVSAA